MKKHYFDIFQHEKYFKKQPQLYSQTVQISLMSSLNSNSPLREYYFQSKKCQVFLFVYRK
jgi:hypothetical protein